jgi:NADH-quinone oxidoreductase subunit N
MSVLQVLGLLPYFYGLLACLLLFVFASSYASTVRGVSLSLSAAQLSVFVVLTIFVLLFRFTLAPFSGFSMLILPFTQFYFCLITILSFASLLLLKEGILHSDLQIFEVSIFVLLAYLATVSLVFCNDFVSLYLGLEFQGLVLYILAAIRGNSLYSTEAGLKYFVLGSFASSVLLFGLSIIYGLTGTVNFQDLRFLIGLEYFSTDVTYLLLAVLFVVVGLLFKVGSVPFHFWVPDVYLGAPLPIVSFFALVPKIGAWVVLSRFVLSLDSYRYLFSDLFVVLGFSSVILALYGALAQSSFKRLIAYSAVGHAGYLLVNLGSFTSISFTANAVYLFIYTVSLLPVFIIMSLSYRTSTEGMHSIYDVGTLYRHSPLLVSIFAVSIFSLAGLPPFSGFVAKLYVLFSVLATTHFQLVVLFILLSVAGSVYYLKLVRLLFLSNNTKDSCFFSELSRPLAYCLLISFFVNISFPFWVNDFIALLDLYFNSFCQ